MSLKHIVSSWNDNLSGATRITALLTLISIIVICVAYAVAYSAMPHFSDDIFYRMIYRDWILGLSDSFPGRDFADNLNQYYWKINVRLANLAESLTCWMPRYIPGVAGGIFLAGTTALMSRIANVSIRQPLAVMFMFTGYIIVLPWHEQMFCYAFMWNYSAATFLTLLLLWIFMHRPNWRGGRLAGTMLLALIVGGWHEGFSVPLFCGLGVWLMLNFRRATRLQWIIFTALAIGILFIVSSDAFLSRLGGRSGWMLSSTYRLRDLMVWRPLFNLYVLMLVASFVVPCLRRRMDFRRDSLHWIIAVCGLALMFIHAKSGIQKRVAWFGETMALIGICMFLVKVFSGRLSHKYIKWLGCVVVACLTSFFCVHSFVVDRYAFILHDESEEIVREYLDSSDGVVFHDFTSEYDAPLLSLKRPCFELFTHEADDFYLTRFYGDPTRPLRCVPECFRNVPYDSRVRKVPGNSGLYEIDGKYYLPLGCKELPKGEKINSGFYTIDFGRYEKSIRMEYLCFRGADGYVYAFAYPLNAYTYFHFNKVLRINNMM